MKIEDEIENKFDKKYRIILLDVIKWIILIKAQSVVIWDSLKTL